MTKDQSAMAVAKISPELGKGGRGKRTRGNIAETAGFLNGVFNERAAFFTMPLTYPTTF